MEQAAVRVAPFRYSIDSDVVIGSLDLASNASFIINCQMIKQTQSVHLPGLDTKRTENESIFDAFCFVRIETLGVNQH